MISKISGLMKTHNCGELSLKQLGSSVTLCGWVNKYRDLGGLHFVDIRDKFGLTQLGFDEYEGDLSILKELSLESVILASGVVSERPGAAKNSKMKTGDIEIKVKKIELLSISDKDKLPFLPHGMVTANDDLRLKYRYLDLRSDKLQKILTLRSETTSSIRLFLAAEGFCEVETPILYKSTPEGARDYIVPSRVHPGRVYALPQSPQTLKQLLMIGGTDKYFQIAKCFRDEDLRADRQPEFSQIDIEVSFSTPEYMKNLSEKMMINLFDMPKDFKLDIMSFADAMSQYGSDKPDIRFPLKHITVTDVFTESLFSIFQNVSIKGGLIKAMFIPESMGTFSRKEIDSFSGVVKPFGGSGVAWFKISGGTLSGGISKFITVDTIKDLEFARDKQSSSIDASSSGDGLWLFIADMNHDVTHSSADALRRDLGSRLNIIESGYHFLFVNDFPLLDWKESEQRFFAMHHPFTMPKAEDLDKFMGVDINDLKTVRADAYDVICNGNEIGGGSMRIYDSKVQTKMFEVLGMCKEQINSQFGFFIEALNYGVPPHGGIAFGLDRIIMLLAGTNNIRDVIAFPKTVSASDKMSGSPSAPSEDQLKELSMKWR